MRRLFKIGVALVGGTVLVLGIVLIPYPGPGWLVVFAGLAILAIEFAWARRLLARARASYDAWSAWLGRQHWWVRLVALVATAAIVLATLWLLNALWTAVDLVGWHSWAWLRSPLL